VRALAFKIIIIENKQYDDEAMIGLEILNPCLDVPLSQPRRSTIDIRRFSISIWKISIYLVDIDATSVSVEGMLVAVFMYVLMIRITSCPSDVPGKHLRFSSAHFLEEGDEGGETIIIVGFAELLHQRLGLFLVELLAEVGEEEVELVRQDGVVLVLVVQLQDLNKVVESTLVLGLLAGLVDGVAVDLLQHPLALLLLTSDLGDGLEGWVEVAGSEKVAGVEGIDLTVSLEVIDVEGEVEGLDLLFLKTKFSHCVVVSSLFSHY